MILSKFCTSVPRLSFNPTFGANAKNALNTKIAVRYGGSQRRLLRVKIVDKSGFAWLMVRYFFVGAIPAFLLVSYCNLCIGNAVLHDHDSEVFQPEHWEYYKHPITRFLARYAMEDPKLSYYKDILTLEIAQRSHRQGRLIQQVEHLQKMEHEGLMPWLERPSNESRLIYDRANEYYEENLKDIPKE